MENIDNTPDPVQHETLRRLQTIGFIPEISFDMPIDLLVSNSEEQLRSLIDIGDKLQRQIYALHESEGIDEEVLSKVAHSRSVMRAYLEKDIETQRQNQERLLIASALTNIAPRGIWPPRLVQLMIEGSHLLGDDEKTALLDIMSGHLGYALESGTDIDYALSLVSYRGYHEVVEPSRYDPDLRRDLATTMVAFFSDRYEGVPLYDELCVIVREAITMERIGFDLQETNAYIPLLIQTAQRLNIDQVIIENLVAVVLDSRRSMP